MTTTTPPPIAILACLLILAGLVILAIVFAIRLAPRRTRRADVPLPPESALAPDLLQLPYQRKKYLLTQAERAFYEVLLQALPPGYVVFTQVRIPALVYVPQGTTHRQSHYNRILAKTVDFVVCSTPALSPCLVIELDDSSHQRPDRQERGKLVDAVLTQAGLPILHVTVRSRYDPLELAAQVNAALDGS